MEQIEIQKLFGVKGKNVLITGGGAGIGLMMTKGFVANGANVYICSRKEAVCQKAAQELTKIGPGKCVSLSSYDLSKGKSECAKIIEELKSLGVNSLDVLINNSGVAWGDPNYTDFDEPKGFDRLLAVNVKSVFYLTMSALPLLQAAGKQNSPARVINVGSIFGIMTHQLPTPSYDMSKAAVHHLTKKLSINLAKYFITVNCLAPGIVPTDMGKQATAASGGKSIANANPLRRVGEIGDMVGAVLYFSSPAGGWVTGTILPVDGGHQFARL